MPAKAPLSASPPARKPDAPLILMPVKPIAAKVSKIINGRIANWYLASRFLIKIFMQAFLWRGPLLAGTAITGGRSKQGAVGCT